MDSKIKSESNNGFVFVKQAREESNRKSIMLNDWHVASHEMVSIKGIELHEIVINETQRVSVQKNRESKNN